MGNIPLYVGVGCILIAGAIRLRTALKDRHVRRQVTDTARCAAGCGRIVRLNEKHVTINRHVEYMDSENTITVVDAESVLTYHMGCDIAEEVTADTSKRKSGTHTSTQRGPFTSTVVHASDRYEVKTRRATGVTKARNLRRRGRDGAQ